MASFMPGKNAPHSEKPCRDGKERHRLAENNGEPFEQHLARLATASERNPKMRRAGAKVSAGIKVVPWSARFPSLASSFVADRSPPSTNTATFGRLAGRASVGDPAPRSRTFGSRRALPRSAAFDSGSPARSAPRAPPPAPHQSITRAFHANVRAVSGDFRVRQAATHPTRPAARAHV